MTEQTLTQATKDLQTRMEKLDRITDCTTPEQIMDWLIQLLLDEEQRLDQEKKAPELTPEMVYYFDGKRAATSYASKQAINARRWLEFCKLYNLAGEE